MPQISIRVEAGGSDSNDGINAPLATLQRAQGLIQNDRRINEVLIRGILPAFVGKWTVSGNSPADPIVFRGMDSSATVDNFTINSPAQANNLAFVDLILKNTKFMWAGSGLLVERCETTNTGDGFVVQGDLPIGNVNARRWKNLTFRFCRIHHNFRTGNKAQGIFLINADDWLMEHNVMHINGWNGVQPRSGSLPNGANQVRSQSIYAAMPSGPGVVRNNVISAAGSHGIHFRCGGRLEDNLFLNNPISWQVGYHYPSDGGGTDHGSVGGIVKNNIAVGSDDMPDANERGIFSIVEHVNGLTVEHNAACLENTSPTNDLFMHFGKGTIANVTLKDNLAYDWAVNPFRNKPASGVTESNNRLNLKAADLHDRAPLDEVQTRTWIDGLIAGGGFKTYNDQPAIMRRLWSAIGA